MFEKEAKEWVKAEFVRSTALQTLAEMAFIDGAECGYQAGLRSKTNAPEAGGQKKAPEKSFIIPMKKA